MNPKLIKTCPVCPDDYGYCARCYCGHPECTAYDSYIDIHNREVEPE